MEYNRRQLELEDRLRSLRIRDEDVLKKMEIVLENQKKQIEIERKMDLILEKMENQSRIEERVEELLKRQDRMEEKIETLTKMTQTEVLLKRQIQVEEKLEALTDVVETNLGWMEYFSEENDRFEQKIGQMQVRMEQLSQSQLETKEKQMKLVASLAIEDLTKTKKILSEINYVKLMITENSETPMFECCGCDYSAPKEPLLREDGVSIECPEPDCKRLQIVGRLDKRCKWMLHEKCGHYQQYPLYADEGDVEECQTCGQSGELRDLVLKCWRSNCKSVLPEDLPLREDGVSVKCPQCQWENIIGTLKEGQKWMYIFGCWHFQQVPLNKKAWTKEKCPYCEKEGKLRDGRGCVSSYS